MDRMVIDETLTRSKFACEDLEALRAMIEDAVGRNDVTKEGNLLIVTEKVLEPVISDIREVVNAIEAELLKDDQ